MKSISLFQVLLATMMSEMEKSPECRALVGDFKNSKGKPYRVQLVASSLPEEMNRPVRRFIKSELQLTKLH